MENNLLTKEEIEKAGFIYEPDEKKCQIRKIRLHVDCNYYKDGKWTGRTTPEFTQEWKEGCAQRLREDAYYWSHINKVFVPEVSPLSGEGVMCRWAMISGYGTALAKKWHPTGLLEGLQPKQFPEVSEYLNRVALKLIAMSPKDDKDGPEKTRVEQIAGMAIPLARKVFEYQTRIEPEVLVEDFTKFYDEKQQLLKDLTETSYAALDGEMEFSGMFEWYLKEKLGIKNEVIIT